MHRIMLVVLMLVAGFERAHAQSASGWKAEDGGRFYTAHIYSGARCTVGPKIDRSGLILYAERSKDIHHRLIFTGEISGDSLARSATHLYDMRRSGDPEPKPVEEDLFDELCKRRLRELPSEVRELFRGHYGEGSPAS